MFTPQTSSRQKPSDIIYTISSAVDSLENATALRQQPNSEEAELRSVLSETELPDPHPDHKLLDASSQQQNVHIDVQELIKTFRPFVAPPAPVPMERDQASAPQEYPHSTSYRGKSPRATQKSYSAVLTILEQTHPDGRKVWKARTGPFREDPLPQPTNPENSDNSVIEIAPTPRHPFIDRMRIRRRAWQERMMKRNEAVWRAISVKRQRKLKMKKHKYKKLMRKTRNLRRRLDKN
ncbi:MAG: hypothetical protein LQ342_002005 [Letrouitia transgressa]|nr:MAG: hypothetical protein LQ342_002005 [Letrouitia transgressa]